MDLPEVVWTHLAQDFSPSGEAKSLYATEGAETWRVEVFAPQDFKTVVLYEGPSVEEALNAYTHQHL